jgi:hypothetical protein
MSLGASTRIGPYEILASIGSGGMGEIYRARDSRLDRLVAIKVLTSARGIQQVHLDRFTREARAIARLNHPAICTLYDVGEQDGTPFLVMELLDGETLAENLEGGPPTLERTLAIATHIAEALDAAHGKNVIHRDLKPSNVMITSSGVKLLDFGLAKLRDGEYTEGARDPTKSLQLTGDGDLLGTLPYMAPEQIEGHDVDTRTDIFSFGVVLYELITGVRPFSGSTRSALIAAIVNAEPVPPSRARPGIPQALERAVERCLAKDPDDRWQTARDLLAELRWIAAGEPGSRASPVRRPRISWRTVALSLVTATAVAGLVLAARTALTPATAAVAKYHRVTFRQGAVSSARFTPDGQTFVYSASWEGAPYNVFLGRADSPDARDLSLESGKILSISKAGDMALVFGPQNIARPFGVRTLARVPMAGGARRDLLDGIVDADWIAGTNDIAVIRDPGSGRPLRVEFPAGRVVHEAPAAWSLRVSPDGSRVAFFEGPGFFTVQPEAMITVVDRSGRRSTLSRHWSGIGLAWSRSGREVWFTATDGGIQAPWLHAVSLAGVERTVQRAPDWLVLHDISPDGRILVSRNTVRINVACLPPGEAIERDLSWGWSATVRGLSADGRTLIFTELLGNDFKSSAGIIYRRSIDGSPAVRLGTGDAQSLSPDGKWALGRLKDTFVLIPTGAGSVVSLPKGSPARAGNASWFGDSKRIVFTGYSDSNRPRGYIQDIAGDPPRAITEEGVVLPGKAAARDDTSVLGRSGDRWLLHPVAGAGPARPVRGMLPTDLPVQWSAGGKALYVVDANGPALPGQPAIGVFRVEPGRGSRTHWRTLRPPDPVGVEADRNSVVMADDARSYCYSFTRRLGDLFIADGLQ